MRSGVKAQHTIIDTENYIRGCRGKMTGSRKGEKEVPTWWRIKNRRLRRARMEDRRGGVGINEKEAPEDSNFTQGRVKIEIASSNEMEPSQDKAIRESCMEKGQCSRGPKRRKWKNGQPNQARRGRGRPRQHPGKAEDSKKQPGRKKRPKIIDEALNEAEQAYNLDSNAHIRNIIDAMEEKVLEEPSDPEMDHWTSQLPDPGHTRGRLTLYHRALHTYWALKHLLAKAMEQVATKMTEMAQEAAASQEETARVEALVRQQNTHLMEIKEMLKAMQTEGGCSTGKVSAAR